MNKIDHNYPRQTNKISFEFFFRLSCKIQQLIDKLIFQNKKKNMARNSNQVNYLRYKNFSNGIESWNSRKHSKTTIDSIDCFTFITFFPVRFECLLNIRITNNIDHHHEKTLSPKNKQQYLIFGYIFFIYFFIILFCFTDQICFFSLIVF